MKLAALLPLVFGILVNAQAVAQEEDAEEAHQRALVLFEESSRLYDAGDFDEAAVLLRQAYEHEANPGILFNLARSLEGAGDLADAADAYEHYLEESDPDDRGAIEARILTLRDHARRLDREDEEEDAEADAPPPLEARPPTLEDTEDASGPSAIPWIITGVGVIAVGVGVSFGIRSGSKSDDAVAEPEMQRAVELHESAETSAILANVFLIGGGVLSAAGLTWGIIDAVKSGDGSAQARIAPGGLVIEGSF